jgi:hypothetical protein
MRSAVTAAVKQAGKALKEEVKGIVKDAAKEAAREATKEAFAQSLLAIRALSPAAPVEERYFGPAAAGPVVVQSVQGYPTFCACNEDARAEITVDGHRVYTCHSCAPRGQALRDYKTALEANKLGPAMPRPRPRYNATGISQLAGSRRRKRKSRRTRKTRSRKKVGRLF